jgi:hypothetical protein
VVLPFPIIFGESLTSGVELCLKCSND